MKGLGCVEKPEPLSGVALDILLKTELCPICRALGLVKCSACGKLVPKNLTNNKSYNQDVKCLDCLHPQCSNLACTTCKTCRGVGCNAVDCNKTPKALKNTELAAFDRPEDYVCQACLFPKCKTCKAEMSKKIKQKKRKNKLWMSGESQRTWQCADCEIKANFHRQ